MTVLFRALRAPALALFGLIAGCAPPPPADPFPTLADGPEGRIAFRSSEPYDFDRFGDPGNPRSEIVGDLAFPPPGQRVRGTVILSHGAGGLGRRQTRMAEILNEAGYATFTIDHFGPRGIESTVSDQLRATEATMVSDIYAARFLLSSHPRIDPLDIGLIGWSKGGTAALLASIDRVAERAAPGRSRLRFAIALYPFCGFDLGREPLGNTVLMLLASEDNWTPKGPCLTNAGQWRGLGQPVLVRELAGADHGFDSGAPSMRLGSPVTVRDTSPRCTLTLTAAGRTVTLDGTHDLGTVDGRVRFLDDCGVRGVTFGGNSAAREQAYDYILAFLRGTLE